MEKVSVSFEWLSVCSGCEVGIIDLHERLLTLFESIDIVRLPILIDVKNYPKAKVGIVSGALRTDHDIKCAKEMRESCDLVLAFGTCAVFGGPQGSSYAHKQKELTDAAYTNNPTTVTNFVPSKQLPVLLKEGVSPLDNVIDIDCYLPGCPPHSTYIFDALMSLLAGKTPQFGSRNVCFKCNRKMKKTDVSQLRRYHEGKVDSELCFLSQGILCMGSATLDRCLAPCPRHGVACFGCAGPSQNIILEPNRDIRTEVANTMSMLTKISRKTIITEIEHQSKTYYSYAMASPVFRQKPTFLLKQWTSNQRGDV